MGMVKIIHVNMYSNFFIGPAAFRPRAHASASYTPSIEKGRPVLQGLLAIDFLAKEVPYSSYRSLVRIKSRSYRIFYSCCVLF